MTLSSSEEMGRGRMLSAMMIERINESTSNIANASWMEDINRRRPERMREWWTSDIVIYGGAATCCVIRRRSRSVGVPVVGIRKVQSREDANVAGIQYVKSYQNDTNDLLLIQIFFLKREHR